MSSLGSCVNCGAELALDFIPKLKSKSTHLPPFPVSLDSPLSPGIFPSSRIENDSCTYARALEELFALPPSELGVDLDLEGQSYLCDSCAQILDSLLRLYGQLTVLCAFAMSQGPAAHWFRILQARASSLSVLGSTGSGEDVDVKPDLESMGIQLEVEVESKDYFSDSGGPDVEHWDSPVPESPAPASQPKLQDLKEEALNRPCWILTQRCDDIQVSARKSAPARKRIPALPKPRRRSKQVRPGTTPRKRKRPKRDPNCPKPRDRDPEWSPGMGDNGDWDYDPKKSKKPKLNAKAVPVHTHICPHTPTCTFQATSNQEILAHLDQTHKEPGRRICPYCKIICLPGPDLMTHVQSHSGQPGVPTCTEEGKCKGQVFARFWKLRRHLAKVHGHPDEDGSYGKKKRAPVEPADARKRYFCSSVHENCDFGSIGVERFLVHLDTFHNEPGRRVCRSCKVLINSQSELKTHIQTHANQPGVFTCNEKPQCGGPTGTPRVFETNSQLKAHQSFTHSDEANYPCSTCGKVFKGKSTYRHHQISKHSEVPVERKYICDQCGASFGFTFQLNNHRRRVHIPESLKIPCPTPGCSYKGAAKKDIEKHLLSHSDASNYQCHMCPKTFKHIGSLRNHFASHANQRPWICTQFGSSCGNRRFNRKIHLVQHINKIHGIDRKGALEIINNNREQCLTNEPYLREGERQHRRSGGALINGSLFNVHDNSDNSYDY